MTDLTSETFSPSSEIRTRNASVIGILLVSTFVVILNETIMAVALPKLMDALQATAGEVQWLTTAFLLTMAVVIPVTGFLIQRMHTRPLFIWAMVLFSIGTLVAALSPNLSGLIVARVVQAVGTAIMFPLLMSTVMTLIEMERRGKVMGDIMLAISVAPAIGPALSGVVLHYLDWRFLFWLVLPISLAALLFGWRKIVNVTTPRYVPVDVVSVPLSALAFGALVYGAASYGLSSLGGPALIVGGVAMVLFVWRQLQLQKTDTAFLDLRTFQSKNFTISVLMMAIAMASLMGVIVLLPIFMQNVLGFDTLHIGLLFLPGGLIMGLMGPRVGKLYDRIGPRPLLVPGAICVTVVLWAMTQVSATTWWVNIMLGHMLMSVGLALVFTPLFTVSLSSVAPQLYAHGSAVLGTVQQVAGAAGVALLVAVMSARSAASLAAGVTANTALTQGTTAAFFVAAVLSLLAIVAAIFIQRVPNPKMKQEEGRGQAA